MKSYNDDNNGDDDNDRDGAADGDCDLSPDTSGVQEGEAEWEPKRKNAAGTHLILKSCWIYHSILANIFSFFLSTNYLSEYI